MSKGYPAVAALVMTSRHYDLLEQKSRQYKTGSQLVKRLKIVLKGSKGQSNYSIARELGVTVRTVENWRKRWGENYVKLLAFEKGKSGEDVGDTPLLNYMVSILGDLPRAGVTARISPSQKQQIVAVACLKPEDYGIPVTRWTHKLLAQVVVSEKIVDRISSRYVGVILKKSGGTTPQKRVLVEPQDR